MDDVGLARFSIFDALTDVAVVLDPAGDIVYANAFATQLLERDPDAVIGRSMAEFLHPDDLIRALEVIGLVRARSCRCR